MHKTWMASLAAALLVACGGGDSNSGNTPSTPASAKGLWTGPSSNPANQVTAVVLSDGRYYILAASGSTHPPQLTGLVQGSSVIDANLQLNSKDGRDFGTLGLGLGLQAVQVRSFNLVTRQRLQGYVLYPIGVSTGLDLLYDTDVDRPAAVAVAVGSYVGSTSTLQGTSPSASPATASVSSTGAVSLAYRTLSTSTSTCEATGQLTPRSDGNVFDAAMQWGNSPCPEPGATLTGIAYVRASSGTLWLATVNAGRTQSLSFMGTRN